jgi:8-oxo-dGTP diphosphatase
MNTVIIDVDMQGTFADDFAGAGLPVPGSSATVDPIRDFTVETASSPSVVAVVASHDWHPEHLPDHMVEPGQPQDLARKLYSRHGRAGTPEAELHPRFATERLLAVITHRIYKGQRSAAFSAFEGTEDKDGSGRPLAQVLRAVQARRIIVVGWELANCVMATALDAVKEGFEVWLVPELCSVLQPEGKNQVLQQMREAGVNILSASEVRDRLRDENINEQEFLELYRRQAADYPRIEHTVDAALFTVVGGQLSILLVKRAQHPFKGSWALPGGFVRTDEGLDDAARRELAEETGLEMFPGYLEQLYTYGEPGRDPRGRVISTAYVALMPHLPAPTGGSDAEEARWFAVTDLQDEDLAYDHQKIINDALRRVRDKVEYEGRLATSFVQEPFTISELRRVYEAVWGGPVHRPDFRRKVLSAKGFLEPAGAKRQDITGGPEAELYRPGPNTLLIPQMVRGSLLSQKES